MENNKNLLDLLLDMKENMTETSLPRFDGGVMVHRQIRGLSLGNTPYVLSVQASEYHYCHPRQTIELENYESFEIALINQMTGNFVAAKNVFTDFPDNDDLHEYFEGSVYGYVPIELVADLYAHAKKATAE